MKSPKYLAEKLGVNSDEYIGMGRGLAKLDYIKIYEPLTAKLFFPSKIGLATNCLDPLAKLIL
jgi:hypothetical protein